MGLIVEDGSGIEDSNSYASLETVNDYHALRSNTQWSTYSDAAKTACLVRATDFIDKRFGDRFRGYREKADQSLAWPRLAAQDRDGYLLGGNGQLPKNLVKATAEYALRAALYNVLTPDPLQPVPAQSMKAGETERDSSTAVGEIMSVSETVGPIKTATSYKPVSEAGLTSRGASNNTRAPQSAIINDWQIPAYPEADLLIEHMLVNAEQGPTLSRGD